jgi:hypothetical protein
MTAACRGMGRTPARRGRDRNRHAPGHGPRTPRAGVAPQPPRSCAGAATPVRVSRCLDRRAPEHGPRTPRAGSAPNPAPGTDAVTAARRGGHRNSHARVPTPQAPPARAWPRPPRAKAWAATPARVGWSLDHRVSEHGRDHHACEPTLRPSRAGTRPRPPRAGTGTEGPAPVCRHRNPSARVPTPHPRVRARQQEPSACRT